MRRFIIAFVLFMVTSNAVHGAQLALSTDGTSELDSDEIVLCKIVEAEAGGEGYEGQLLVAEVILNRVQSNLFPNDIRGVVFQKNQFSPIMDGRYWDITPSASTVQAVREAIDNGVRKENVSLLFFQNIHCSGWINSNRPFAFTYRNHNFYE